MQKLISNFILSEEDHIEKKTDITAKQQINIKMLIQEQILALVQSICHTICPSAHCPGCHTSSCLTFP